jgi:hypothetical protein
MYMLSYVFNFQINNIIYAKHLILTGKVIKITIHIYIYLTFGFLKCRMFEPGY